MDLQKRTHVITGILKTVLPNINSSISYCVLSDIQKVKPTSDIDILVENKSLEIFITETKQKIQNTNGHILWEKPSHNGVIFSVIFPAQAIGLRIDVYTRPFLTSNFTWPKLIYSFDVEKVLASRVLKEGLYHPHDIYAALHQLFRKTIKSTLKPHELSAIKETLKTYDDVGKHIAQLLENPNGLQEAQFVSQILDLLSNGSETDFQSLIAENLNLLKTEEQSRLKKVTLKLTSLRTKRGMMIAFIGPDGSGKSTLISSIMGLLAPAYGAVEYNHLRSYFFKKVNHSLIGSNKMKKPHDNTSYGFLVSLVKFGMLTSAYIVGGVHNRLKARETKLIIFDRYFYDIELDPKRFLLTLPKYIVRTGMFFYPTPDITIALCGDPEKIHARKDDLTVDEIRRQVAAITVLAQSRKEICLIDCNQTPSKVLSDVLEQIIVANENNRH